MGERSCTGRISYLVTRASVVLVAVIQYRRVCLLAGSVVETISTVVERCTILTNNSYCKEEEKEEELDTHSLSVSFHWK